MPSPPMSQDPAAPAAEPAKKSKKALLVAAVVVLGVVGGGGAGAFLAGPMLAGTVPAAADSLADSAGAEGGAEHEEGGTDGGAGTVVLVDNMVLNPANSGGQRFLLVSIGISVKDQAVADAMKERDPELRDAVLRYLGAKPVEELSDIARRDSLKVGLRAAVTEHFGAGAVRDVYFPQFVVQ